MLKRAIIYKAQLDGLIAVAADDKENRYFSNTYWQLASEIDASSWNKHQFVSVDKNENVVGLLIADLNRGGHSVSNFGIMRFLKDNQYALLFSKDLRDFMLKLLLFYNYRKIEYTVAMGSPQERWYDSYTEKYGGRVVGIYKEHFATESGSVIDLKMYELFRRDFIQKYQKFHPEHYKKIISEKNPYETEIIK